MGPISAYPPSMGQGHLVGQKRPSQPKNVWSIGVRLEIGGATRELALDISVSKSTTRCRSQSRSSYNSRDRRRKPVVAQRQQRSLPRR